MKLDLTQFAELTARANSETSVMIRTLGNFLLRGEANLDFTVKGGALKLNPDLPSSSKICQEHMERHGPAGCDHLLVVESKEFTFALLVPHDHSISVPFRWAILDQPFGDWSLADRERWSEAFEYVVFERENIHVHHSCRCYFIVSPLLYTTRKSLEKIENTHYEILHSRSNAGTLVIWVWTLRILHFMVRCVRV